MATCLMFTGLKMVLQACIPISVPNTLELFRRRLACESDFETLSAPEMNSTDLNKIV
jgi:hypothetical protein